MEKRLKSYLEFLQEKSELLDVPLIDAFKLKDISLSTYYRTMQGTTELKYGTARKVNHSLEHLAALREHRARLKNDV
jgi:hypothetical protein